MADTAQQLKQAITYIKAGDKATAVKLITAVIQTDKANPDAWYLLATALVDRDKQIKALENALKINSRYSRAQVMLEKLRPSSASAPAPRPVVQAAPEPRPASAFIRTDKSDPFEDDEPSPFEDVHSAFTEYDDADFDESYADESYGEEDDPFEEPELEEDPFGDADPRLHQAVELIHAGKREQAERLAQAVLTENREDIEAWWVLANAVTDDEKRKKCLNHVLKLNPDHTEAREWLQEIEMDNDPDAFSASMDEIDDDENPFAEFEESADPFIELEKSKNKSKSDTPNSSMGFEFVSFIVMFLVAVGAYYGLQTFVGVPGSMISEALISSDGLSGATSFGMMDMSGESFDAGSLNSYNSNCPLPTDLNQQEVRHFPFVDVIMRGSIAPGQTAQGYKYEMYGDGYTFSARAGQTVTFLLYTATTDYDTVITVYRPDGSEYAEADEGFRGDDERLQVTFDSGGDYTIVVDAFTYACGDYTLSAN